MSQLRAEMKSRDRCSFNFLFQFQLLSLLSLLDMNSLTCVVLIAIENCWLDATTTDLEHNGSWEMRSYFLVFLHVSIQSSLTSTDDNLTRIPPSNYVCSGSSKSHPAQEHGAHNQVEQEQSHSSKTYKLAWRLSCVLAIALKSSRAAFEFNPQST